MLSFVVSENSVEMHVTEGHYDAGSWISLALERDNRTLKPHLWFYQPGIIIVLVISVSIAAHRLPSLPSSY